jgi:hypothetical protein
MGKSKNSGTIIPGKNANWDIFKAGNNPTKPLYAWGWSAAGWSNHLDHFDVHADTHANTHGDTCPHANFSTHTNYQIPDIDKKTPHVDQHVNTSFTPHVDESKHINTC